MSQTGDAEWWTKRQAKILCCRAPKPKWRPSDIESWGYRMGEGIWGWPRQTEKIVRRRLMLSSITEPMCTGTLREVLAAVSPNQRNIGTDAALLVGKNEDQMAMWLKGTQRGARTHGITEF